MKNECTVENLKTKLPNVGDLLIKVPVTGKLLGICATREPRRCKVTYVNREHLWYQVQFESGYREVYKLPESSFVPQNGTAKRVRCVETGVVYPSMRAAGKAVGCASSTIYEACMARHKTAKDFHWKFAR